MIIVLSWTLLGTIIYGIKHTNLHTAWTCFEQHTFSINSMIHSSIYAHTHTLTLLSTSINVKN